MNITSIFIFICFIEISMYRFLVKKKMLRRAAPLVRSLRCATSVVQSSSSSNGDNIGRLNRRGGTLHKRALRRDFKPQFVNEHAQLMRKHGDTMDNSEIASLNDAIERINWYSSVSKATLEKVANMIQASNIDELNSISDRSMATLFSSFGEICREKRRDEKRKLLEETVKSITDKGYPLGALTRTSIFSAKVDMTERVEELPSFVEELSAWESARLTPTEDITVNGARVYAIQGDRKGVIELTNYARESFGRVEVRFLQWLAFSMVASGETNGITAIEKLSRSAPDSSTQLWLNGALAAATKADLKTTVDCLSRIPLAAKLQHSDHNGIVVDILIQLIEREVEGVEESLSPFLSLSGDGTSLHERHGSNAILVFKARRAVNEGKMEVATRLYSFVHDMQKSKSVEFELRKGVGSMGKEGKKSVENVKRCAMRLQQSGIIEDANSFCLSAFRGEKQMEFIQYLRSTNQLTAAVEKCRVDKFSLATQLINHYSSSPFLVTPNATAILYSEGLKDIQERDDVERIVFKAAKEDVDVVSKVLEELTESNMSDAETLGSHIVTAAFARILMEKDVISSGRIEKLLMSPNIPTIRMYRLMGKLNRLIQFAKEGSTTTKAVEIASGVISAAFKNGGRNDVSAAILVQMIGNTATSEEKIEMLVNLLTRNPNVGIGLKELEKAQKLLEDRGLKKRAELMGLLKKKSQASQRWMASSPEDLEKELDALEKAPNVSEAVLTTIRIYLMDKISSPEMEKTMSTAYLIPLLEKMIPSLSKKIERKEGEEKDPWEKPRLHRLREMTEKVYENAMRKSVMDEDWNGAERLWNARGNLRSLPIAPSLVFSFHQSKEGSKELSGEIVSAIRSNGQSVENKDLYEMGDLLSNLSMDELTTVGEWLKKELRVETIDVARIKNAKVKRSIGDLIASGRILDAFNEMKENSENNKNSVGHLEVMRAAINLDQRAILESTVNLVSSLHSKATAILDLAFAFLMEKKVNYGESLFKNPSLKLSSSKVKIFVKNAMKEQRIDVVHSLFSILVSCPISEEKVSNTDLNYLALTTLSSYVRGNNEKEAIGLVDEIEESTLVVERQLQGLTDRVKKTSSSSSV